MLVFSKKFQPKSNLLKKKVKVVVRLLRKPPCNSLKRILPRMFQNDIIWFQKNNQTGTNVKGNALCLLGILQSCSLCHPLVFITEKIYNVTFEMLTLETPCIKLQHINRYSININASFTLYDLYSEFVYSCKAALGLCPVLKANKIEKCPRVRWYYR